MKKNLILIIIIIFMPMIVLAGAKNDGSTCDSGYTQNGDICEKVLSARRITGKDEYTCEDYGNSNNHEFEDIKLVNGNQCLLQYSLNPYGSPDNNKAMYGEYDEEKSLANPDNQKENSSNTTSNLTVSPSLNYNSICANEGPRQAAKIVGYVIQICKWIVPLMIIILGMMDFGKAVISSDEKAINKATSSLIKRFIAGIVVFFIPTIVMAILNLIKITNGIEDKENTNFGACTTCLFDPSECK